MPCLTVLIQTASTCGPPLNLISTGIQGLEAASMKTINVFTFLQVREKLLSKQIAIERSEKAKKMRELRKYGKKVRKKIWIS